uniref:Uncharacterized protein n=1 Tax=Helianthus annuus TaxID=4232 RepID=A0A251RZU4_HELAN
MVEEKEDHTHDRKSSHTVERSLYTDTPFVEFYDAWEGLHHHFPHEEIRVVDQVL